jgi:hypothetical protein
MWAGRGGRLSAALVLQWPCFGVTRTIKLHINPFEHSSKICGDLGIPESDNAVSFLLEPELSFAISPGGLVVVMMPAVEFDDEMRGGAEKVHDVRTNRRLLPEMGFLDRQFL